MNRVMIHNQVHHYHMELETLEQEVRDFLECFDTLTAKTLKKQEMDVLANRLRRALHRIDRQRNDLQKDLQVQISRSGWLETSSSDGSSKD